MKFDVIITNNHQLKKNGYKVIRKLRDVNRPGKFTKAASASCNEGSYYYLACKALVELMKEVYLPSENPTVNRFFQDADSFLNYLNQASAMKEKLNTSRIAAFERDYTTFFHYLSKENIEYSDSPKARSLWGEKCLMAHLAVWSGGSFK